MIYHTDFDKAQRCPAWYGDTASVDGMVPCPGRVGDGGYPQKWRVYRCPVCGISVARVPLLPHHRGEWHVFTGRVTWRLRAYWFWVEGPRRRWENRCR